ncbi:MAG TPA: HPr family phosphocarrier protein [Clostridiales bacterium]|nr:HPr family phosphocarrier protein [Clostridiales bacterium]
MVSRKVTVLSENGLHFRPANAFATEMDRFQSEIRLFNNGAETNAKSIIGVLSARIKYGSELTVTANGPDEEAALKRAVELLEEAGIVG